MDEVRQVRVENTDGQYPFQPESDFRQEHQTHGTPETFDIASISKPARSKQNIDPTHPELQPLSNNSGGIPLPSQRYAASPARTFKGTNLLASAASSRAANVSARRPQKSSLLLASPARQGHTSRMAQMFAAATTENRVPRNHSDVLYPRLPNISRTCIPVNRGQEASVSATADVFGSGPGSSVPTTYESAVPDLQCLQAAESPEESSGSWSGDSSYLMVDNPPRRVSRAVSSEPRIDEWLSTIPRESSKLAEGDGTCDVRVLNQVHPDGDISERSETVRRDSLTSYHDRLLRTMHDEGWSTSSSSSTGSREHSLDGVDCPRNDIPLWSANTPHTPIVVNHRSTEPWSPLDDVEPDGGGIALSSLSPNVCVERGPSRHHSSRRIRPSRNPGKVTTPTRIVAIKDDLGPQSAKALRALGALAKSGGITLSPANSP